MRIFGVSQARLPVREREAMILKSTLDGTHLSPLEGDKLRVLVPVYVSTFKERSGEVDKRPKRDFDRIKRPFMDRH